MNHNFMSDYLKHPKGGSLPLTLYFDMEFTGLHKHTDIISIAIISNMHDVFYAEITDYDTKFVDSWIQKNVINNLCLKKTTKDGTKWFIKATKQNVANELLLWLRHIYDMHKMNHNHIQFVSDVGHYDFMLLIDLIAGNALDLPKYISAFCHDINQDIAYCFNCTDFEAFDMNREELFLEIARSQRHEVVDNTKKHSALWDACIIMGLYKAMHNDTGSIPFYIFHDYLG